MKNLQELLTTSLAVSFCFLSSSIAKAADLQIVYPRNGNTLSQETTLNQLPRVSFFPQIRVKNNERIPLYITNVRYKRIDVNGQRLGQRNAFEGQRNLTFRPNTTSSITSVVGINRNEIRSNSRILAVDAKVMLIGETDNPRGRNRIRNTQAQFQGRGVFNSLEISNLSSFTSLPSEIPQNDLSYSADINVPDFDFVGETASDSGNYLFTNSTQSLFTISSNNYGNLLEAELGAVTYDTTTNEYYGMLTDINIAGVDEISPFYNPNLASEINQSNQYIENIEAALEADSNSAFYITIRPVDFNVFEGTNGFTSRAEFDLEFDLAVATTQDVTMTEITLGSFFPQNDTVPEPITILGTGLVLLSMPLMKKNHRKNKQK